MQSVVYHTALHNFGQDKTKINHGAERDKSLPFSKV